MIQQRPLAPKFSKLDHLKSRKVLLLYKFTFRVFIKRLQHFFIQKLTFVFHSSLRKLYWKTQRKRRQRLRDASFAIQSCTIGFSLKYLPKQFLAKRFLELVFFFVCSDRCCFTLWWAIIYSGKVARHFNFTQPNAIA